MCSLSHLFGQAPKVRSKVFLFGITLPCSLISFSLMIRSFFSRPIQEIAWIFLRYCIILVWGPGSWLTLKNRVSFSLQTQSKWTNPLFYPSSKFPLWAPKISTSACHLFGIDLRKNPFNFWWIKSRLNWQVRNNSCYLLRAEKFLLNQSSRPFLHMRCHGFCSHPLFETRSRR